MRRIDLMGRRFHRLVVTGPPTQKFFPNQGLLLYWPCVCDCGATKYVYGANLRKGNTKSCGCWIRDYMRQVQTKHGWGRPGYGASGAR